MPILPMRPNGTMVAVEEGEDLRFLLPAVAIPHVRIQTTIPMFRTLVGQISEREPRSSAPAKRLLVIQFDDYIHNDIRSVAYCRPRGNAPAVELVPDPYFFLSRGYDQLRGPAVTGRLPSWEERQDIVFWRGGATNNGTAVGGSPLASVEQIPRVVLCRILQQESFADVALSHDWALEFPPAARAEIFRPPISMVRHADYRYLIDIDGVASAWGFFEKLLLGSCVLKVASPFEQWYYDALTEWRHFVPVRADFGDLLERIEWCREHPGEAREIAEAGQRFALEHTFETARQSALDAIIRSRLVLAE